MFGKRVPNCVKKEEIIREEPEKDTYWMITKANRENLIKLGGVAEEIGRSATNNFQNTVNKLFFFFGLTSDRFYFR